MRNKISVLLLFVFFVVIASCTNDEGSSDLDVLTPVDSTDAQLLEKTKLH